jgi:hypothetical protein
MIGTVPLRKLVEGDVDTSSGFGVRIDPFVNRPTMHSGLDFRGTLASRTASPPAAPWYRPVGAAATAERSRWTGSAKKKLASASMVASSWSKFRCRPDESGDRKNGREKIAAAACSGEGGVSKGEMPVFIQQKGAVPKN